jgi:uncharacterized protein (TIRG00374 family)
VLPACLRGLLSLPGNNDYNVRGRQVSEQRLADAKGLQNKAYFSRWIGSVLLFVALSCGVPYVIYQKVGAQSFSLNPQLFSWPVLAGAAVLLVVYFTSDALRLHYILKAAGRRLDAGTLGKLTFMNILFSNITPMATGGGFAQVWYLRRRGVPIGTAMAATTIRTFIAMVLIFFPVPFLVAGLPYFRDGGAMAGAGWTLAFFAIGYLACFLMILYRLRWLLGMLDAAAKVLVGMHIVSIGSMRRLKRNVLREAVRFSHCLRIYTRGDRWDVMLSVLFTAVFLLSLFSFPYLLLRGAGYQADYLETTGLLAVSTCIMYFAPSPGGAGFAEGIFGLFFASMVNASELVGIMLLWRFLTVYLGMLIGVPVTLHEFFRRGRNNA